MSQETDITDTDTETTADRPLGADGESAFSSIEEAISRALSRTLRATSAAAAPETGVDRLP